MSPIPSLTTAHPSLKLPLAFKIKFKNLRVLHDVALDCFYSYLLPLMEPELRPFAVLLNSVSMPWSHTVPSFLPYLYSIQGSKRCETNFS